MKTATFTYLGAKCEYNFETKNLHIVSKQSFNWTRQMKRTVISKKHNIKKEDIKTITFKYNNTQLPSQLYHYFSNYPNLESIELEKLDFKNVKSISRFIYNCPKLKEITITHKNAENLAFITDFIVKTKNTTSITIKHINAPNLQEVNWLLWHITKDIQQIIIEDITAPNIDFINRLIDTSTIKTLDLTKIGNVNVHTIHTLLRNCYKLETLKLNPLTNIKEIGGFIEKSPALKTDIISKINKVKKLKTCFLTMTAKNETLDLNKFEDINNLALHLNLISDQVNNLLRYDSKHQYPSIKIGRHKIKLSDYSIILENNIPIIDKTEEEIVKEIITQSKNETKENIENFLETLENKKIFKNEEYKKQLKSKLTIIKNLK